MEILNTTKQEAILFEQLKYRNNWNWLDIGCEDALIVSKKDFIRVVGLLWELKDNKIINITNGHRGEVITEIEQFILDTDKPIQHINGLLFDCRRENLRILE